MQGKIKMLDASGHTTVEYDTDKDVVEEAEQILQVAAAGSAVVFDAKTKEKVAKQPSAQAGPTNRGILEEHEELLVVPPIAGG